MARARRTSDDAFSFQPCSISVGIRTPSSRSISPWPIVTVLLDPVVSYRFEDATIPRTSSNCLVENYNLAVLSFKIANEQNLPIFDKLNFFRQHIWQTLAFSLFVRPTRLSNIIVDTEDKNIVVTFTLLDVPPKTGSVENPVREASLDRLVSRLSAFIDDDELVFRARYGSKQVVLRAVPNSLNVEHRSTEVRVLHTGPRITGMWLGFILAGLVVSAIVSFFVFKRLTPA